MNSPSPILFLLISPIRKGFPMYTREQYLDHVCTHEQYYDQFVTSGTRATVANYIGLDRIRASEWPLPSMKP